MAVPHKRIMHTSVNTWNGKLALELECQKFAHQAVSALVSILNDVEQPAQHRIAAAAQILDRGYGKPVDRIALSSVTSTTNTDQYNLLSTRELLQLLAGNIRAPIESSADNLDVSGE